MLNKIRVEVSKENKMKETRMSLKTWKNGKEVREDDDERTCERNGDMIDA